MIDKALIVVDMQNDFISGPLGTPKARAIVPSVKAKIEQYVSACDSLVFFTMDTHDNNYLSTQEGRKLPIPHCIRFSDGWQIIDELRDARQNSQTIYKDGFGYVDWALHLDVYNLKSIELVGVCTDMCVLFNAFILKTIYPEIEIIVDASCCAGTTPEAHAVALYIMENCQFSVINNGCIAGQCTQS